MKRKGQHASHHTISLCRHSSHPASADVCSFAFITQINKRLTPSVNPTEDLDSILQLTLLWVLSFRAHPQSSLVNCSQNYTGIASIAMQLKISGQLGTLDGLSSQGHSMTCICSQRSSEGQPTCKWHMTRGTEHGTKYPNGKDEWMMEHIQRIVPFPLRTVARDG